MTSTLQSLRVLIVAAVCAAAGESSIAQPSGPAVVAGSATFSSSPGALTISQASGRAIINWQEFSIAAGEAVRFVQPDALSATLNRVVSGAPSKLLGNLEANGSVYLINPNGVVIGAGARIDTNGFLASTLDVSDAEFLKGGDLLFKGDSTAAVQNLGAINALGGDVFLIARRVENAGTISAANGIAGLAAGSEVLLTTGGSERVFVRAASTPGEVVNAGAIAATSAELKAAGGNAYALAINHSGVVRATGSAVRGGQVWLVASGDGEVVSSGTIVATNDGGARGGEVQVRGSDVTLTRESSIDVSGVEQGGRAIVIAERTAQFSGEIYARGAGFVEVSGRGVLRFAGRVFTGGGTLLIDPADITVLGVDGDEDSTFGVGQIATMLLDGNDVILEADNDITWESDAALDYDDIGAGGRTLALQAGNNIVFSGTIGDGAAGGDLLNVVLNADHDASGAGSITLTPGASIRTGGGRIELAGGSAVDGDGYLTGRASGSGTGISATAAGGCGILLNGAALQSDGGDIRVLGQGSDSAGNTDSAVGVFIINGTEIDSGAGTILIDGRSRAPDGAGNMGVNIRRAQFGEAGTAEVAITSANPTAAAITLIGAGPTSGGSSNSSGINIQDATSITATAGGGGIALNGTGGVFSDSSNNGINFENLAGKVISTTTGPLVLTGVAGNSSGTGIMVATSNSNGVTLGGAGMSGDITFTADKMSFASGNLTVQSTGHLLVQPLTASRPIGLGSGAALALSQSAIDAFANGFESITIGRADGSGAFTINAAISFQDPVTLRAPAGGGSVTVNGALSTGTGSEAGSITLQAANQISVQAGKTITTVGEPVTLNADRDASGYGFITIGSGASIVTSGGAITLGGGSDPAMMAAKGETYGVRLSGSLDAGSGAVSIRGEATATSGNNNYGINVEGGTVETSGAGAIVIVGTGAPSSGNTSYGVGLNTDAAIEATGSGGITITGTGGGTTGSFYNDGVAIHWGAVVSSAIGDIDITGTAGVATGANMSNGVSFQGGVGRVESTGSAAVSITGTGAGSAGVGLYFGNASVIGGANADGDVTLTADNMSFSSTSFSVQSSGALLVQPLTASTSIGLGSASGTLSLPQAAIDTFVDGFASITIGRANGTGQIDVNGATFGDPLMIRSPGGSGSSGGEIVVNGALATTGDISLLAGHNLTVSAGSIMSGGGDVMFNSDRDASGYGTISFAPGTSVYSNGGDITLRGGNAVLNALPDPTVTATEENFIFNGGLQFTGARGDGPESHGVTLDGVTLNAEGGDIIARGIGAAGKKGVFVGGNAKIMTAGDGTISLLGAGGGTGDANDGVYVGGEETVISTADGGITFYGMGRGGVSGRGVVIEGIDATGPTIESGDGNIVIGGSSQAEAGDNQGVLIASGGVVRTSAEGDIAVNGRGGSGDGGENTGIDLRGAAAVGAEGSGNVIVAGTAGLGSSGVYLDGTTLGSSTGTGDVTVTTAEGFAMGGGSWLLANGGTISVEAGTLNLSADGAAGLMADDGGTLLLSAASGGVATGSETAIQAGVVGLSGAGDFNFAEGSIYIDTLAADVTGDLAFTNAQEMTVGTAGALSGITASGDVALTVLSADGLAIATPISVSQKLTLYSEGGITASASVDVGTFQLDAGDWTQVSATLPEFAADDFRLVGGSFLRVLGGDGTSGSPYQLGDVYGLQGIAGALLDKAFVLENDIDAATTAGWNDGAGFVPIADYSNGTLSGVFDGDGHMISGLTIDRPSTEFVGLFGYSTGTVKNVQLTGADIAGSQYVGVLVGHNAGTVSGSSSAGSVAGTWRSGGLVGYNYSGAATPALVSGSSSSASVNGESEIGGLVGYNDAGNTIEDSHASGAVTGRSTNIGGLVGYNLGSIVGTVTDGVSTTYATGNVGAQAGYSSLTNVGGLVGSNHGSIDGASAASVVAGGDNSYQVGGLVGLNEASGEISNSFANGTVSANDTLGGLVGRNGTSGQISQSYASGAVTALSTSGYYGYSVGGLVGASDGAIDQAYATGPVKGATDSGGLVGYADANSTIIDSYATGDVGATTDTLSVRAFGGLVGRNFGSIEGTVVGATSTTYATGDVSAPPGAENVFNLGGLVGNNAFGGTISGATASGAVSGGSNASATGGLVGFNTGAIEKTYATGAVEGSSFSGGLVGTNAGGTITQSYATGAVDGHDSVGGLIGDNESISTITQVYATGDVDGGVAGTNVGGLIGNDEGNIITQAYATGAVHGGTNVGGLIGNSAYSTISETYATGAVTSSDGATRGGLIGRAEGGEFSEVEQSWWDMTATGQSAGVGLLGEATLFDAIGLTTAEARDAAGFMAREELSDWDFTTTWAPPDEGHYAQLYALTPVVRVDTPSASRTYGAANPSIDASTLYGGPTSYVFGPAGDGGLVVPTVSTSATVTSNVDDYAFTGDGSLNSDLGVVYRVVYTGALSVTPAPLTASLSGAISKVYDGTLTAALAADGYTLTGVLNDDIVSLSAPSAGSFDTKNVGVEKTVTFTGLSLTGAGAANYSLATTELEGDIGEIRPASLTYVADAASRTYGATNPTFAGTVTGFVDGEDLAGATTGVLVFGSVATATTGVGNYAIDGAGLTANHGNYAFVQAEENATALRVTPAALTITADDASKVYGQALMFAGTEFTVDGLQNDDAIESITLESAGAAAVASVAGGPYAIEASAATGAAFDAGNYDIVYEAGVLTVTRAPLTISAGETSRAYGATNPVFMAGYDGFVLDEDEGALDGTLSFATAAGQMSDVGEYAVMPSGLTSSNYEITFDAGVLEVTPAPLTVTAGNASRGYGETNPAFGATYLGFVLDQDESALGGALTLATDATTTSPRGNYTITPSGLTSTNYAITFVPGTLSIDLALLTITANTATKLYGAALPNFSVSYSGFADGDDASVLGGTLTFATPATAGSDVGSYDVLPGGVTSDRYAITFVPGTLSVTPAPLVVKANDAARVFRNPNPTLSASYEGFVLGQNESVLEGSLELSTSATIDSPVGNYAIAVSGLTSSNYGISFVPGTLAIGRAVLTVRADDFTKLYGAALPEFTASFGGFEPGDTVASSVTGSLTFTTVATASSDVGRYSIVPGGVKATNYAVEFVPGTLTISPAELSIIAHDATRSYGAPNPNFSASFEGFVNGDTAAALSGALTFTTEANAASNVGAYTVTPGGVASTNYAITLVPGTLTVDPAALTITAEDYVRIFGAANPSFTARYDGLVNGETASVVSGLTFATDATPASVGGTYAIVPGGATAANYVITFVPGSLVVSQVVVVVDDVPTEVPTIDGEPALTGNYAVVVRGDSLVLIPVDGTTGVGTSVGGNLTAAMDNAVTVSRLGEGRASQTVGEVLMNLFGGSGAVGGQVVATIGGAGGAGSGGGLSLANVPSDQNLMRETTVNMGGFNVVYREAVDEVREQDETNTAFGSSFREFLDSESPQVVIVRDAPGQHGPDERENANDSGAAL